MSDSYFISDLHIGQKSIINYRFRPDNNNQRFETVEEHDNMVIESILSTVGKRDILWLLGDNIFNGDIKIIEYLAKHVRHLNTVPGNHDFENKKSPSLQEYLNVPNVNVYPGLVKYKEFWLSHAPVHSDHLRGRKNVHGHVHPYSINDPNYINVCVESDLCNFKPISITDIRDLIASGEHAETLEMQWLHSNNIIVC